MTLSLERLLQEIESLRKVAEKLGDGSFVQSAATNRLADTASKLGKVVQTRTPDDRIVSKALDDLTVSVEELCGEVKKIKRRVTALALRQGAVSEEDITQPFDIPKIQEAARDRRGRESKAPPIARALQAWGGISTWSKVLLIVLAIVLTSSGFVAHAISGWLSASAANHTSQAPEGAAKGAAP